MSDWPDQLPGLNIKLALSQLGGKKTLYLRLLGMFKDGHSGDVDRLLEVAATQDWTAVHEVNHALKGVTGNLAASELYELCVAVDKKMKADNHDIQAELDAMPAAMATLLEGIEVASQLSPD